ncbi:kinase A anchor protein [Armillaria borealis]|uniref:Kinase A anchor protein n=1 Tax=Armillaria borealis TaxID=47425 RepID=A0AA39JT11_9AGAR|nr:kinase A anchor protein [Armillaria borealis]
MVRPTHFLSIPLGQTHPTLRARVADLHAALNLPTPDSTLLAGPQRVHLTLGVMTLTTESLPTALDLLQRLSTLLPLTAAPPTVSVDTLDVLKRESRCRARVLWVGPSQPEPLFSQINQIFRDEGFITDTRPLKLHMTLMNSIYRRPRTKRSQPFDYDAILRQTGVLGCFGVQKSEYVELPMAVSMGSYEAPRVHLCEMGSWDTDGAYVSCGSAPLSKESV